MARTVAVFTLDQRILARLGVSVNIDNRAAPITSFGKIVGALHQNARVDSVKGKIRCLNWTRSRNAKH